MQASKFLPLIGAFLLSGTATTEAYEFGAPNLDQPAGLEIGIPAAVPPPGIYGLIEPLSTQGNIRGPGSAPLAAANGGNSPSFRAPGIGIGFLYNPGLTIFGATYTAFIIQPAYQATIGNPINSTVGAPANTFLQPLGLTWKIGDSGFYVSTNLGTYIPDGQIKGSNGLGSLGNPFFSIQPTLVASYIKGGYDITVRSFLEIDTANTYTGYRNGTNLEVDFTATRNFGKFKIGPVASYAGQITNDHSSAYYGYQINTNRFNLLNVGGLIGYDFGPASVEAWVTVPVVGNASGGSTIRGVDNATVEPLFSGFLRVSFKLPGQDTPASSPLKTRF